MIYLEKISMSRDLIDDSISLVELEYFSAIKFLDQAHSTRGNTK